MWRPQVNTAQRSFISRLPTAFVLLLISMSTLKKKGGGGGRVPYKIVDFRLLLKSDLPHQSSGLPVS